ncbi:leucine-rich repeat-containing protein kinase family protein [Methylobacterium sp. J-090]|uniref:leucine-rich repeat-containing protein kinase family protein n=1 Tax=Methylobacterium sp. J-090 TaxID=2836666 RepID=UPI001FB92566|nr:leucine-rich repeat-containing protein kinase family protein [Methylobacterium sp. J-090]MCJ2080056.1 leucine-rich repeat-containing serine/threonine-protein kinase [Methylobacterium sp. J-090]
MVTNAGTARQLEALARGDLLGTHELRFSGGFDEFPRDIFGLADSLEVLDLGAGSLTTLPDDLGRLTKLRVLFCSGNPFDRLPPSLGDCPALAQIGFRGCGIGEVPEEALPPSLRWLTLTDNRIATLPGALGRRPHLQKLMLSGNRLTALPESLADARSLELIRLSANGFDALPAWLATLPALAWPTWAGNPLEGIPAPIGGRGIPWADLVTGDRLGEGASGEVFAALWRRDGTGPGEAVALKLFKGAMTSDGLPEREMEACLAAGTHPNLTGGLGRLVDHPTGAQGLVMPRLPQNWRVLAGPPSLASCSRDVYESTLRFEADTVRRIARSLAAATAHLHARGLLHGDLYGHNVLWDGTAGDAVLSDFGAACRLPEGAGGEALQRIEVRAWGILLGELLARCPSPLSDLTALAETCVQAEVARRPLMAEVAAALRTP